VLTNTSLGTSIVSVQIGEGDTEQTHIVHEALLGDRSKCLQSILSEMHSQDSHKIVAFKNVDPKAFALYIQYLYTGNIPSKPSQKTAAGVDEYSMLCNLYVFAFQQEDSAAQNAACDAIHAKAYDTRCSNNSSAFCSDSIYYKRATIILYISLIKLNRLLARNAVLGKS